MRVLVVDDSKAMRMVVRRAIRQAGYRTLSIDEAEHPLEAWRQIRSDPPDLVISDWHMPEMSGIELLRRLRGAGCRVPFGFITSRCTKDAHEQAKREGAMFLLSKPVTEISVRAVLVGVFPIGEE